MSGRKHPVTDDERAIILNLHEQGKSIHVIAARVERSRDTVSRVISGQPRKLRRYTDDDRLEILHRRVILHESWPQIGRAMGASPTSVQHAYTAMINEAALVKQKAKLTNVEVAKIRELAERGYSAAEIARRIDRGASTVQRYLYGSADTD